VLKRILLAGVALVALASPAHADPLSALIATISTAAASFGSAITGALAALGISGSTLLTIGFNLITSLLFQPKGPKPQDVQGVIRQSVPVRTRHYGLRRLGGALLFIETHRGNLYQVIALGQGEFDGFEEFIVDNRTVTLTAEGYVNSLPYMSNDTDPPSIPGGGYILRILSRNGTEDQTAFDMLVEKFPTIWTADHRNRGIANAMLYARGVGQQSFSRNYPNRIPILNAIARTSKLYDPRQAGQIIDDPSTWAYTAPALSGGTAFSAAPGRNLALQLADYLRADDGMQNPAALIDWESVATAANVCDEVVTTKAGGTIARYHGGLSYMLSAEPRDVISRFLQAMDGRLYLTPAGKIGMMAGAWIEPTVTIRHSAIIMHELTDGSGPLREANEIIVKYVDAEAQFAEVSCDPWRDEADITATGAVKTMPVEAYEVESHNHARRIAKLAARRASPRWQGTIVADLSAMEAWDQRWIRIQEDDLGIDETFEVQGITLDIDEMTVTLKVISFDATAYDFDPATEEGTAPTRPEALEEEAIPTPANVTAQVEQQSVNASVSVAVITLSWDAPEEESLVADAQISVSGSGVWTNLVVNATNDEAVSGPLVDGEDYDVRVRFRSAQGTTGPWVTITGLTAVADAVAPGVPTALSVVAGSVAKTAKVRWTGPASANLSYFNIYQNTTNTPGTATDIGTVYGLPLDAREFQTAVLATGTYYFWVTSVNGSGVESARTAAGSIVIP
jgi:hypothetical protein